MGGWVNVGSLGPQKSFHTTVNHNFGRYPYSVTFGLYGNSSFWTWIRPTVTSQAENSFGLEVYNDNSQGVTVTGIWIYWTIVAF